MKGLRYLFFTTLKNSIKQLVKNPAKLVMVLVFVLLIGLMVVSSLAAPLSADELRDPKELSAMVLVLYGFMFFLGSNNGFSSGASFYSMADVNLLFSCPISQKKILVYGLIRQLQTSLLLGFFLIFQYGWLYNTYGISVGAMLAILLGYCAVTFCSQLTAMTIYSFTSADEGRKRMVKYTMRGVFLVLLAAVALPLLENTQDLLGGALKSATAPWVNFIPIFGWLTAAVTGVLAGNWVLVAAGAGATAAFVLLMLVLVTKMHADFYEDVLKATEVSFSAITSKKEGQLRETVPKNIKTGAVGIGGGSGASAFYYKHKVENRRARVFLLDTTSLVFVGTIWLFSFFMRDGGLVAVFAFATYMQIFSVSMGRWLRELTLPYVYLVPAGAFQKLLAICRETILKICVEAVLVFLPAGLILQAKPLEIAACIFARIGFGVLFMAGNIMIERILGTLTSKTLILFLYFLILIVLAAPGVVLGVIVGIFLSSTALAFAAMAVWNLGASILIFYLCRDILNYAELNNK